MAQHKCPECGALHEMKAPVSTSKPRIMSRSRWTNTKSNAPAARAAQIEGVALHYPGQTKSIGLESEESVARRLEGYRRHHVNGNGWKDIAYNVAVDQHGRVWTLRGVSRQSGANGTSAGNRAYGSILLLVGNTEAPSDAMVAGVLYAVRLWDARYKGVKYIRPHSYFVQTSCPGAPVRRLLNDGRTFYMRTARERWPDVR